MLRPMPSMLRSCSSLNGYMAVAVVLLLLANFSVAWEPPSIGSGTAAHMANVKHRSVFGRAGGDSPWAGVVVRSDAAPWTKQLDGFSLAGREEYPSFPGPARISADDVRYSFLLQDGDGNIHRYAARFIRHVPSNSGILTVASMLALVLQRVRFFTDMPDRLIHRGQRVHGQNGWIFHFRTARSVGVHTNLLRDILQLFCGDPRFATHYEFSINIYDETNVHPDDEVADEDENGQVPLQEPGTFAATINVEHDTSMLLPALPLPVQMPIATPTDSEPEPSTPTRNRLPAAAVTPPSVREERERRVRQRVEFPDLFGFLPAHGFMGPYGGSDGLL